MTLINRGKSAAAAIELPQLRRRAIDVSGIIRLLLGPLAALAVGSVVPVYWPLIGLNWIK